MSIKDQTDEEIVDCTLSVPQRSWEIAAPVEMTRRLIIAIKDFNKKSSFYTKVLIALTVVLIVLTIIIAILTGVMIFTK